MNILLLTDSTQANPLAEWLEERERKVTVHTGGITLAEALESDPGFIISVFYEHSIPGNLLDEFRNRIINLQPSYLPWNRGYDPMLWSCIEGTPKGVSMHRVVDSELRNGDILVQERIEPDEDRETLATLKEMLVERLLDMFHFNWSYIRERRLKAIPREDEGSYHAPDELVELKKRVKETGEDITITELRKLWKEISGK
ncbi:formyltransferase family protein [Limisalsivibrio acetivorans]|uniref:formyltransferase family protein n=1 Tax=Limisalsivibrio acetivorans TaxID=1304888 RepID=UPI0003B6545E|nr:formyltransferase family protein [Limisalsivibrio acetivorans]